MDADLKTRLLKRFPNGFAHYQSGDVWYVSGQVDGEEHVETSGATEMEAANEMLKLFAERPAQ